MPEKSFVATLIDRPVVAETTPAEMAKHVSRAHVKPLDGLRGVAILLVILPHIASAGLMPGPAWLQSAVARSAHGVDIFFVLSGFGLAYPLIVERLKAAPVRFDLVTYAFNRLYRILPAFYAAVVLAYVASALLKALGRAPIADLLVMPKSLYEALAPLVLFDGRNLPINPNLWTIAVQVRWYFLFPVLLLVWMKSPRAFFALLGCAWLGYLFTRERTIDLGSLPLFMLGMVAAELIARRHRLIAYAPYVLPLALVAALAWDPHAMVPDPWGAEVSFFGQPTSFPWHIVAFALVLVASSVAPIRRVLSWRPLVALGTMSFSIYLVHQPVLAVVAAQRRPAGGAVALTALLAVGFAFWWCVERPLTESARRRRARERFFPD